MVVDKAFHVTAAADMAGIAAQIDEDSAGNKKEAEKGSHSPEQKTVSLPEWENRFIWQRDTETGQSCSLEKHGTLWKRMIVHFVPVGETLSPTWRGAWLKPRRILSFHLSTIIRYLYSERYVFIR